MDKIECSDLSSALQNPSQPSQVACRNSCPFMRCILYASDCLFIPSFLVQVASSSGLRLPLQLDWQHYLKTIVGPYDGRQGSSGQSTRIGNTVRRIGHMPPMDAMTLQVREGK